MGRDLVQEGWSTLVQVRRSRFFSRSFLYQYSTPVHLLSRQTTSVVSTLAIQDGALLRIFWAELWQVRIGRLGLSASGQAVWPIEAMPNRVLQSLPADLMDAPLLSDNLE